MQIPFILPVFSEHTNRSCFDLDSQQFMQLYSLMVIKTSHWPAPEPMYSPPHPWLWLAIPSSSWPILPSTQNYTSFNPKDTGSTFFWNVGNCQSEWPGQYPVQYMIWSHMNIWHAYHQAIWVHSLFWHHLLEAACSLLLEFSTCIHLQIQFQLTGRLHHDATWATAINTNLMDSTESSEN